MRIAWLGKKSPACGNVTYCREITNALVQRKHHVTFLHFASKSEIADPSLEIQLNQTVALPYLYKSIFYTIPTLQAYKRLTKSLERFQFDLIHASLVLSPIDFRLPAICEKLKLPLFATFHQPFDSQYRTPTSFSQQFTYQLYASTLAVYNRIIVFSSLQKTLLEKLGVPDEKIAVIPNSVDTEKYSPGISHVKKELQAQCLFLYQGRIAAEKNVESLLQAWSRVSKPEGYKLAIVGTGPLAAKLQARYDDRSILWMGFIEDEPRRIAILRAADVFILPSLVEGLSLALLEAMACGTACVATDVGSHSEVLAGGAGILIDVKNTQWQLCKLLPILINDPDRVRRLGDRGRQRILENYALSKNIDRLETVYAQTLDRWRSF